MATKKTNKAVTLVRCIECKHSTCCRRGNNPTIAICSIRKSFGEAYRQVANSTHLCEHFQRFDGVVKYIDQMK